MVGGNIQLMSAAVIKIFIIIIFTICICQSAVLTAGEVATTEKEGAASARLCAGWLTVQVGSGRLSPFLKESHSLHQVMRLPSPSLLECKLHAHSTVSACSCVPNTCQGGWHVGVQ